MRRKYENHNQNIDQEPHSFLLKLFWVTKNVWICTLIYEKIDYFRWDREECAINYIHWKPQTKPNKGEKNTEDRRKKYVKLTADLNKNHFKRHKTKTEMFKMNINCSTWWNDEMIDLTNNKKMIKHERGRERESL